MNTVYIVQEPQRRNRTTGDMEPSFDLTPAAAYGDLNIMLQPGNVMLSPQPMVAKLRHELRNYTEEDRLLAIGDPVAYSTAVAVASRFNNGRFSLLKWDREARAYISVDIDITGVQPRNYEGVDFDAT